ncbi:hypothetical protein [Sphingomonas bacterium]|uniref:hypothetical protein n=1 Tax=Sphingomonas bacterium TaxID=1895847 RepID=UPI0015773AF2|nr:hypothetical protein [Sphingomonas bacterium]
MLRFGPEAGPVVVLALPLFEEANRTRAFGCAVLRALAVHGIGGVLPDLPGQGDSLIPLETLSLLNIQEGYEYVVSPFFERGRPAYGVGIRSGALLDSLGLLHGRWYLTPQGGPDLLRELRRIRHASVEQKLSDLWYFDPHLPEDVEDRPVELAGNLVSTALLTDLTVKEPWAAENGGPLRVVRLIGDTNAADRHLPGSALWRRTEPGCDTDLAQALAADIAAWIARCEG